MNLHRSLRTSVRIWLAISIPLFIAAWFLRGGKGGDEPFYGIWWVFLTHDYFCSDWEMVQMLITLTLFFAVPAAVAGWILQFPICMALDYFHCGKTKDETHRV